jgi:hypothetical protein
METVASVDRTAVPNEAEWIVEHCPEHGCVEPETDVCHCEIADRLRSLAAEERAEREAQAHLDQLADELPAAPAVSSVGQAAHTTRSAVLREAADRLHAKGEPVCPQDDGDCCWHDAVAELRRMADETQPAEAHSCANCDGIDPDTCWTNPNRPPEQCPAAEFEDYGQQCTKPSGHNLHSFEEQQPDATPPAGGAQQPKEADGDRIVAYRSALPGALSVYCTNHTDELGDGVMPLTSDDLPDGGVCAGCGVDVLIPQQPKEA